MRVFFHLSYSPWSEKARWALEHHRIAHRAIEHLPMLGEPILRIAARRPLENVSVPMLLDGPLVLRDSFAIASHAERIGQGARLFPEGLAEDVRAWNESSEILLSALRVRLLARMYADDPSLLESVPRPLRFLGPVSVALARSAVGFIKAKYGLRTSPAEAEARASEVLVSLDRALEGGSRDYLLGRFSFADIAMAAALYFVEPGPEARISVGPRTREMFRESELSRTYLGLVRWRDRLYGRHRSAS